MDTVRVELVETDVTFVDLAERATRRSPLDRDPGESARILGDITEACRMSSGRWDTTVERSQKIFSTGFDDEPRPGPGPSVPRRHYYPGQEVIEAVTHIGSLPTSATIASLTYLLGQLTSWLKNRDNRHARIRIGKIDIDLTGPDSIERALEIYATLQAAQSPTLPQDPDLATTVSDNHDERSLKKKKKKAS